jgi:hypothetical protein
VDLHALGEEVHQVPVELLRVSGAGGVHFHTLSFRVIVERELALKGVSSVGAGAGYGGDDAEEALVETMRHDR